MRDKKLFKSFSIYTLSSFLSKGIAFLLLPILTHYLTQADYGLLAIFTGCVRFLMPFINPGIESLVGVEYFKNRKNFSQYLSSVLLLPCILLFVFFLIVYAARGPIADFTAIPVEWILGIPIIGFMAIFGEVLMIIIRNEDRPILYGVINIVRVSIEIGLSIYFIVLLSMDWQGRIMGWFITTIIMTIGALWYLSKRAFLTKNIRLDYMKGALLMGAPLIIDSMRIFVMELSDRFFINKMVSIDETGLYSLGSQIGMIMLMLLSATVTTFFPFVYASLKEGTSGNHEKIVKMTYLSFLMLFVALILLNTIGVKIIFTFFIDDKFSESANFVLAISLAYFCLGLYEFFKVYLLYLGKTILLSFIAFTGIILNLVLNYYLILEYGTIGAAYATCISYLAVGVLMMFFAMRLYPMPWFSFLKNNS